MAMGAGMTTAKKDLPMPKRTPAYVTREIGAVELCISPDTWDQWVKAGLLPRPIAMGIAGETPRWRWADVDAWLSDPERRSLQSKLPEERFFRELGNGPAKERRRADA